jgi:hypothetical protein
MRGTNPQQNIPAQTQPVLSPQQDMIGYGRPSLIPDKGQFNQASTGMLPGFQGPPENLRPQVQRDFIQLGGSPNQQGRAIPRINEPHEKRLPIGRPLDNPRGMGSRLQGILTNLLLNKMERRHE